MIVQIIQTLKTNGKWFYADQQYLLVETVSAENPECMNPCNKYEGIDYGTNWGLYHKITVNNINYFIPEVCCSILPGDEPSTNMDPHWKRMLDYYTKDPVASLTDGRTDVVKQSKMIYGIDIRQSNTWNTDVDMVRYNELIALMKQRGYVSQQTQETEDVPEGKKTV